MRLFLISLIVSHLIISGNAQVSIAQDKKPLRLADAVSLTLELNRELGATRFETLASKHSSWEAWSQYLPQVGYTSQFDNTESDRFEFEIPEDQQDGSGLDFMGAGFSGATFINRFEISQLVFDRSVIGNIIISRIQRQASKWQEVGQEQISVADTITAFLDVLRAQELLEVQNQRLALAREQLETATSNFEVGLGIRTDVLRAELTRSSAERDVVSAQIRMKQSLATLNWIVGVELQNKYELQGHTLSQYDPNDDVETILNDFNHLYQVATMENPSIQVASLLVDQQKESIEVARGEFYPTVNVEGSWGYNDIGSLDLEQEEWRIALIANVPIFESGRRAAKISRTKDQLSAEEQRYENTVRQVLNGVEVSSLSLLEEKRNLEIAMKAEEVAIENHERFLNLYQEGLADTLDVTQALTELVTAQTDVVTARYNYMRVYTQLLQNLGIIPTVAKSYETTSWLKQLNQPIEIGSTTQPEEYPRPDGR